MLLCLILVMSVLVYIVEDDSEQSGYTPKSHSKKNKTNKTKEKLVTVEKRRSVPGYIIGRPDEMKPAATIRQDTSHIVLDQDKLEDLRLQTQIAQELLSDIFTEEEEVHLPDSNTGSAVIEALQKLLEKDTWQREEVQQLLGANVMIGNMLEQINDYAYSKVDDIVVEEDGDTINVTTEYKEQLI